MRPTTIDMECVASNKNKHEYLCAHLPSNCVFCDVMNMDTIQRQGMPSLQLGNTPSQNEVKVG